MQITRIQYPIGQGCFHVGSIRSEGATEDSHAFHYVYDCGSDDQNALGEAIVSYKNKTSRVDALFVSHLDRDHVNGIDQLLGAVKVDTVYIPYVNKELLILDLIKAELDGNLSSSLVEASLEPNKWFRNKGVNQVIRVRSSPEEGIQDPNIDASQEDPLHTRTVDKVGAVRRTSKIQTMDSGTQISCNHQNINWTLVPHVDPTQTKFLQNFNSKVRIILGLKRRESLNTAKLLDAVRDNKKRKCLRECYDQIIRNGAKHMHNRVSMSLYSGPMKPEEDQEWKYVSWYKLSLNMGMPLAKHQRFMYHKKNGSVGWIGTGDAMLQVKKVRNAWKGTYTPYQDFVFTLLLPHHGSKHNFDPEVLEFPNLELCAVSAGDPSRYCHPSPSVELEISNQKKIFCHVSQFPQSALYEEIFLASRSRKTI